MAAPISECKSLEYLNGSTQPCVLFVAMSYREGNLYRILIDTNNGPDKRFCSAKVYLGITQPKQIEHLSHA